MKRLFRYKCICFSYFSMKTSYWYWSSETLCNGASNNYPHYNYVFVEEKIWMLIGWNKVPYLELCDCIRAEIFENIPSDMYPQWRLKSAGISTQSDQSSLSAWRNFASLAIQNASSEDSDWLHTQADLNLLWATRLKVCFLAYRDTKAQSDKVTFEVKI